MTFPNPGSFGFAWVNEPVAFDSNIHFVEEEKILGFQRALVENNEPACILRIKNRGTGLLINTWNKWGMVSYKRLDNTIKHLFLGRRVGIPVDLQAESVNILLTASPPDLDVQKEALAAPLRVLPYWDIAYIKPEDRENPDVALEGRTVFWHINHLNLDVSLSDWVNGEAGTITVDSGLQASYDSVRVSPGKVPIHTIFLEMWGYWSQRATGSIDVSRKILEAAAVANSPSAAVKKTRFHTYTGQGMFDDWPEPDANIGGDWRVGPSSLVYIGQAAHTVKVKQLLAPTKEAPEQEFDPDTGEPIIPEEEDQEVKDETNHIFTIHMFTKPVEVSFFVWSMNPTFWGLFETDRKRVEYMQVKLTSDIQPIKNNPGEEAIVRLSMACQDLAEPLDEVAGFVDLQPPIRDVRNRQYFNTARGYQSIDFGLRVAGSKLVWGARCIDIEFTIPFEDGIDITTKHSLNFINDHRVPGNPIGKVVSAILNSDPQNRQHSCTVKMSCLAGEGNPALVPEAGTPDYVEDDYIEIGHFARSGAQYITTMGIIIPDLSNVLPNDDGIDFHNLTPDNVTISVTFVNGKQEQEAVMDSQVWPDAPAVIEAVKNTFTEIQYVFRPLNTGPHQTDYNLGSLSLPVAKQIDLRA